MKDVRRPALKNYVPVRFYATDLAYTAVAPSDDLPSDAKGDVTFRWDWRFVGQQYIDILLGITLAPTKKRAETVQATMVGAFRLPTEQPDVTLDVFTRINGPTMLMPYLREAISSLTSRGFVGTFLLPPINVHKMIANIEGDTSGARQVADDIELGEIAAWLNRNKDSGIVPVAGETQGHIPKKSRKRIAAKQSKV